MELITGFKFCLYFFKFFCYFPFNVNLKSLKFQISVNSVIWSVVFSGSLILFGQNLDRFSDKNIKFFKLLKILHRPTSFVIIICVIFTIINSGRSLKIIKSLISIYKNLIKFEVKCNFKDMFKFFLLKYTLIQVLTMILTIIFYLTLENKSLHGLLIFNTLSSVKYTFPSAFLLKFDLYLMLLQI